MSKLESGRLIYLEMGPGQGITKVVQKLNKNRLKIQLPLSVQRLQVNIVDLAR